MKTQTCIPVSISVLMNAFEGVNLTGELAEVYQVYTQSQHYAGMSPEEQNRIDSLYTRLTAAFDLQQAREADYNDNYLTCENFRRRAMEMIHRYGRDCVFSTLSAWWSVFATSEVFDLKIYRFEQDDFKFRFKTLTRFLQGCE